MQCKRVHLKPDGHTRIMVTIKPLFRENEAGRGEICARRTHHALPVTIDIIFDTFDIFRNQNHILLDKALASTRQ